MLEALVSLPFLTILFIIWMIAGAGPLCNAVAFDFLGCFRDSLL